MQIASGIHRIGDRSIINAYLIEEANEVTAGQASPAATPAAGDEEVESIQEIQR